MPESFARRRQFGGNQRADLPNQAGLRNLLAVLTEKIVFRCAFWLSRIVRRLTCSRTKPASGAETSYQSAFNVLSLDNVEILAPQSCFVP